MAYQINSEEVLKITKMNTVSVTTAKELKAILKTAKSVAIEGHNGHMTGLECSNAHCHYYSAYRQGEVFIKFPAKVSVTH